MIFTSIIIAIVISTMYFLIRNNCVLHERLRMRNLVFRQKDWLHYSDVMHNVSYEHMLYHFWVWPISKTWPQELRGLK